MNRVTANTADPSQPSSSQPFSRPPAKLSGDWSAHIATTLDRLTFVLAGLDRQAWDAPSHCAQWRVRDVVGHILWRLGSNSRQLVSSGLGAALTSAFKPNSALAKIAIEVGAAPEAELLSGLEALSADKMAGIGRSTVVELTEAVVHAYDITDALQLPLRLSPRSTSAVALSRLRVGGRNAKIARKRSLRAIDAGWQIGNGPALDATAQEIIMHLFGRTQLAPDQQPAQ